MIKSVFSAVWSRPKMLFLIYGVGFVLAMLVARPFYVTFLNEADTSVALDALLKDFDFMIFSDFINQSSNAFKPLFSLMFAIGIVYLFLSNFFDGGILQVIKNKEFTFADFFAGGSKLFGKFLMLLVYSLIFLLVLVAFSGMFFFIFASIGEGGSEKTYFFVMLPPIAILTYFFSVVIVQNMYAKVMMSQKDDLGPWEAFGKAFGYVMKRPVTFLLFWGVLFVGFLLLLVYLGIDSLAQMSTSITIFLMFLVQQVSVLARTFLKIFNLTLARAFFDANPISLEKRVKLEPNTDLEDDSVVRVE